MAVNIIIYKYSHILNPENLPLYTCIVIHSRNSTNILSCDWLYIYLTHNIFQIKFTLFVHSPFRVYLHILIELKMMYAMYFRPSPGGTAYIFITKVLQVAPKRLTIINWTFKTIKFSDFHRPRTIINGICVTISVSHLKQNIVKFATQTSIT